MRGADKKSRSREAFAAVFEEQTRRFSPFELLGISSDTASLTHPTSLTDTPLHETSTQRTEEQAAGQAQILPPDRSAEVQGLNALPIGTSIGQKAGHFEETEPPTQALRPVRQGQTLGPEGLALDQTLDPQPGQTLDGLSLGQTVRPRLGQTPAGKAVSQLGPDRQAQHQVPDSDAPLLAPLQWAVWEALKDADAAERTVSYRQLARETKSTIDGVRKAVRILLKEGGLIAKNTVRTAQEQGFCVVVNRNMRFRRGTLNEAKAILKRGLSLGQTPDRQATMLGPDGLRMFVCRNTNIKQTDIGHLLRLPPPNWHIREQTLTQIAD